MKSSSRIIKKREAEKRVQSYDSFFSAEAFDKETIERKKLEEYIRIAKEQAHKEAETIINEAKKQAVCEQQAGFEEGLRQGLEKVKPLEACLSSMINEVKTFTDTYPVKLEPEVVAIIMNVCSRIIKDSVEKDKEVVLRNVQAAFSEIADKEYIKIRCHIDDVALLREFQPSLIDAFHEIKKLEVVADESVDHGGCIIETNEGNIDATIKTQLKKMQGVITCEAVVSSLKNI